MSRLNLDTLLEEIDGFMSDEDVDEDEEDDYGVHAIIRTGTKRSSMSASKSTPSMSLFSTRRSGRITLQPLTAAPSSREAPLSHPSQQQQLQHGQTKTAPDTTLFSSRLRSIRVDSKKQANAPVSRSKTLRGGASILVAVDGSRHSIMAMNEARNLARVHDNVVSCRQSKSKPLLMLKCLVACNPFPNHQHLSGVSSCVCADGCIRSRAKETLPARRL